MIKSYRNYFHPNTLEYTFSWIPSAANTMGQISKQKARFSHTEPCGLCEIEGAACLSSVCVCMMVLMRPLWPVSSTQCGSSAEVTRCFQLTGHYITWLVILCPHSSLEVIIWLVLFFYACVKPSCKEQECQDKEENKFCVWSQLFLGIVITLPWWEEPGLNGSLVAGTGGSYVTYCFNGIQQMHPYCLRRLCLLSFFFFF